MGKYLGMKYNLSPEVHKILDAGKARIASIEEQAEWVVGHYEQHADNQSYRLHPKQTAEDTLYVIARDIDLPPLYGEEALTLIVPPGVKVRHRALGDNRLLYMDGFAIETDPEHDIILSPAVISELDRKMHIGPEEFLYAEATLPNASPEQTLGLISEGAHAPGIFTEICPDTWRGRK